MITADAIIEGRQKIADVGLGYVGLLLASALARKFRVIGFDISLAYSIIAVDNSYSWLVHQ